MKVSIYHELWNSGEYSYTLKKKNPGLFQPKFGSNMGKPKY